MKFKKGDKVVYAIKQALDLKQGSVGEVIRFDIGEDFPIIANFKFKGVIKEARFCDDELELESIYYSPLSKALL